MNRIRSGDAEIAYSVLGDGPPVVLLHPFPANHEFWIPAAQALTSRYRVILPDLRAHGESQAGEGSATMEKHASDIARVLEGPSADGRTESLDLVDKLSKRKEHITGVPTGFYDLDAGSQVIRDQIASMQYGRIQAGIASWWGQATKTDSRISALLAAAHGTSFCWTLYYEPARDTLLKVTGDSMVSTSTVLLRQHDVVLI
jgi:hypothetical protein